MKTIFSSIQLVSLGLYFLVATAQAEKEIQNGFIRLANSLSAGTEALTLEIDGKNVNPDGYIPGDYTGGIKVPVGNRSIKISREGTEPGITKINVLPNETTIVIPFAEKVPATDAKPAFWAIRILRLKQRDTEKGLGATFISVCQNPEVKIEMRDPNGNWNPYYVKRLAVTQAPILSPRGYVSLRSTEGRLDSISLSTEGNYVVLLYDDENGKLKSLNFMDQKFLSAD